MVEVEDSSETTGLGSPVFDSCSRRLSLSVNGTHSSSLVNRATGEVTFESVILGGYPGGGARGAKPRVTPQRLCRSIGVSISHQ